MDLPDPEFRTHDCGALIDPMRPAAARSASLTPAQHAFVRQLLALIPLLVWVVYVWSIFFAQLPGAAAPDKAHVVRDFVHFYAQGIIAREHNTPALYDIDAMAAVVARVVPEPLSTAFPPVYGPQVPFVFVPFALLPYLPAMLSWLAVTMLGYAVCVYLVWRACPSLTRLKPATVAFALGAPGFHFTLSYGQASLIGLICFTVLWLALQRRRDFVAGLAVGALAYKPQLGLAAAFVFLLVREWRVVQGAVVAVAMQALAGAAYWGPGIFVAYVRALLKVPGVIDGMEPDKTMMHSLRPFFQNLGLSSTASLGFTVAASLATLVVALRCWRAGGDIAPRYTVLVLATLLVNPHLFAYDLLLLTPALLVVWDWANDINRVASAAALRVTRMQSGVKWLALLVYAAPILTLTLPMLPVQWSVVGFVLLGGLLAIDLLGRPAVAAFASKSGMSSDGRL